ncbi:TolC family outer membrane protein [Duganella sp. CY15W]|uniref:TolC family outer membrane protein n=1 Tax=Duganella sp. CY15W TaxID=2692172 RepID=UPI00136DC7CA|nr:TolC family outer membrane protein [Duganella sp. CY15W]MYM30253.1 TolC family outer membrane protein [Duganella sp. CY15W]
MHKLARQPKLGKLVGAVLASLLAAGNASAISLMQAYEAALNNDPTYLSALHDAQGGKEYANLGRSNLLPSVQASYSAAKNRADQITHLKQGDLPPDHPVYYSRSSSVTLRQPVFSLDAWARYKQGKAQTDYSDANYTGRLQEVMVRVSGAYVEALFANEQVRIIESQRAMYLEQKKVNDRMFAKGEGTKTDMLETQSKLDLAEAQLLEALDNQQVARATLGTLIGQDVTQLDELLPQFRIAPMPEGGFETWHKMALEHNPDLEAQTYAIEAAKQEVNKNRAGHTPRVDFVASYTKSNSDTLNTYNQDQTVRSIGVQINIPLYSGGAVSASTRQAAAGLAKARDELQIRTDKVMLDLRKQYTTVVSSVARIRALDQAVDSGQLLVKATEQSIKGGIRINLDLLNAQAQLNATYRDLAQARYNYLMSSLRLKSAAGVISIDDIREIGNYFH